MASGWSVMDALNKNSKAAAEDRPKARFRTRDISIRKMYSNEGNFYSMPDIEELAQQILAVGLMENMTVTYEPCEKGEYKIIAGERRWRALNMLLERGFQEFEIATCQIKTPAEEHEEKVQLIIANAYRSKTVMDILEEEKQLKASLQYMRDNGLTLQGYKLDSGRLRDVIADIMNKTPTKIAQIESINNRLIPEFSEELKEGRLTFSAAYEISGMAEEKQKELIERYRENGLTMKQVKEAKEEAAEEERRRQLPGQMKYPEDYQEEEDPEELEDEEEEEEWQQAHPEGITSLCYSCLNYTECNVRTGTCTACDKYIDKEEALKTDEERYNEEQDRIDRETKRKLRELEDEEKMQNLPSERKKYIRVSQKEAERIRSGLQKYVIVKETGIEPGMDVCAWIFSEGRNTGEQITLHVTQRDNDETSSAIEGGYTVFAFEVKEGE